MYLHLQYISFSFFICRILQSNPELKELCIELPLFTSESTDNTPLKMADLFQVPYLGSIPLDNNLMVSTTLC
jgi:hypothetical protein